ncbi:glycosyl hydrolase [Roseivirga sp. BDSF3-8]|uniref:glycosyl hydrolase n=1 Tax=Roseivirga sp. BDSF3-8 TaxID=3241598 RepID=UPI003531B9F7
MRKLYLMVVPLVALLFSYQSHAQTAVSVGPGSYASYPPTHEMDGTFTEIATNAQIDVQDGETRPIPTNDWWTNLIYDESDELGGRLWAMPLVVDPSEQGLNIYHPTKWNAAGNDLMMDFPVVLKGAGFAPARTIVTDWSDWSVDAKVYEDINNKYFNLKAVHGSPFVWTEIQGFTPQVECYHGASYLDAGGNPISFPFTGEYFVIEYWDTYYGVHMPAGSTVSRGGLTGNLLTINLGSGANYLVFSGLPNAAAAATMHPYAYVKPTNTTVSWNYDINGGEMNATWTAATANIRGAGETAMLQGFLPHHYRTALSSTASYTGITYKQARGTMQVAAGTSFSFNYSFSGILPHYTAPKVESGANPYQPGRMTTLISEYTANLQAQAEPYGTDTYWGGKDLVRIAKYMLMAKETNHPDYNTLLSILKDAITDWCTYTPGETERYYAWYPQWKALVGFNESYYSGVFTDNHFHYGYLIQAAALAGMADPAFVGQYEGMLTMVAKQYANWDRSDANFPFMRTFDPWMGHSYAGGVSSPNGNNQESTSEAMQSWHAMFFLGSVLGNDQMRDAGAFGYMYESRATLEYWFNQYGDIWPSNYDSRHDVVGIMWPGGYVYGTYFGTDPQWIHGIQMLPISPGFHYFNDLFTEAEADTYYQGLLDEMYTYYNANGDAGRTDGGVVTEAEIGRDWANVLFGFKMLFDPEYVTQKLDQYWVSSDQEEEDVIRSPYTGGISYYYAHALQNLGTINFDYHMSMPMSATFVNDNNEVTHVVYNPSPSAQVCQVYLNGSQVTSFTVPGHTLYNSSAPVSGGAPVASLSATPLTGQSPLVVSFDAGGSTDPDGDVLSYSWNFGDGTSGSGAAVQHTYASSGTYNTTVTVSDGTYSDVASVQIVVSPGNSGNDNLALNKPATSSSVEGAYLTSQGNDGNGNTRWSSEYGASAWMKVDLEDTYDISRVVLDWERASAESYHVMVSDVNSTPDPNSADWTIISTQTGMADAAREDDLGGLSGSGRYIAIYGYNKLHEWGYSLWEVEVYGTQGNEPPVVTCGTANLALNQPAVSSTFEAPFEAPNAFDGDAGTRWGSGFTDNEWIRVDLGGTYAVCEVVLNWEAAYGNAYEIRLGATTDLAASQVIASVSNGDGGIDNVTTDQTVSGRYVWMQGISRALPYGYSLYEMEVYGASVSTRMSPADNDLTDAMMLFPNPVQSVLNFRSKSLQTGDRIRIYTATGKQVMKLKADTDQGATFDVSSLQPGIYLLRIEGSTDTFRFTKQ